MNEADIIAAFELADQVRRETEIEAIRSWFDFIDHEREARATWSAGKMIDWKPEAIEAALSTYWGTPWTGAATQKSNNTEHRVAMMRAALDAAIKAQFETEFPGFQQRALEGERAMGRAEAFEEAAAIADKYLEVEDLAEVIRALAKELPK